MLQLFAVPQIQWGYILPPMVEIAGIFTAKPELAPHLNKTYTFEAKFVRGSPLLVTALATEAIDVANLGFWSLNQTVVNASLKDLRIIADEAEDGVQGYFASETRVMTKLQHQ